jgi:S-adenosylmethionine synthetase
VQISYAIGVARPLAISVNTEGTARVPEDRIEALIAEHFDLRPRAIIDYYKLRRPIFKHTARYGHFGHTNHDIYTWERTEKAAALRQAAGL